MDSANTPGSCLCGGVRFQLEPPFKFCVHCHCSLCRRAHGAPMVTWVGVPTEQFEIVAGEELLSGYSSSQEASRRFCSRCGSSLFFESTRWPDEVHVAVANLEAPRDLEVQAHVFFDDRANWLHVSDELPRLGGESGTEPLG